MINWQRVWAVMHKDWLEVIRNKQLVASLVIAPVLFSVVLPSLVIAFGAAGVLTESGSGLRGFNEDLPASAVPAGLSPGQVLIYAVIVYLFAPLFLMIPVMVASITASSSLVGEKERRTIEGLFYTPLTNRELILAKVLGSVIPAIGLTWTAFLLYTGIVNGLGAKVMGGPFFPTGTWVVLILLLVPLIGFLATSVIVAVSARSTTMQGAQSTAIFVLFPVIALVSAQAAGLMLFDVTAVLIAGGILVAADLAAFFLVVGRFRREILVTRL